MHRLTLILGLVAVVVMCLVPPVESGVIDDVANALRGEEVSPIEYRPI